MSTLSFVKYHGAGNDFILIDDRALVFDPTLVPKLCHRKTGIGADGVILLQPHNRMRIYNCDGTQAESCGNGLRCLIRFMAELQIPPPYHIATANRIVEGGLMGERVWINMGEARELREILIEG